MTTSMYPATEGAPDMRRDGHAFDFTTTRATSRGSQAACTRGCRTRAARRQPGANHWRRTVHGTTWTS